MGWRSAAAVLGIAVTLATAEAANAGAPITRGQLQDMFEKMRSDAHWDLSRPMIWGYFFTHRSRPPLERASKLLEDQGYRVVDFHRDGVWWLHVEKVEAHSVDSLDVRNQELGRFAKENGLDSYDGMDAGPAPSPP